jgi:DNA-directed RNA polymerase specialized sigma24 family protein
MEPNESRFQFGQTRWSLIEKGQTPGGDSARNELLERYHAAIYRFLQAKLKDPDAVDEVHATFVDRLLSNHPFLQRASQEKGRFRHYLRRVLSNLVADYHRQRSRDASAVQRLPDAEVAANEPAGEEEMFREEWVKELMNHAWTRFRRVCESRGQQHYEVLLQKARSPELRSQQLADNLSKALGKPISAANIRQMLHRGQEMLSDCFLEELQKSLGEDADQRASADRLEQELIDLGMLDSARREALQRFREKA